MRDDEARNLKIEHVDFKAGIIKVWSFKNHKFREIPLLPEVIEAIKYSIEANSHFQSEWLFPMPSNPSRHIVNAVSRESKIKQMNKHFGGAT